MKNEQHVSENSDQNRNRSDNIRFSDLLRKRRSVRKFLEKSVGIDLIKEIINECTYAPSAGNEQPWKFIIIQNKLVMEDISTSCKETLLARIVANPEDYAKKYERMLNTSDFNIFYNAPCLVLILGDSGVKNLLFDCTLAASYFMMSAAAKGLGTCWINFAQVLSDPILLERVGVPNMHTIVAPIIVGFPLIEPSLPSRKEPDILKVVV